MEYEGGITLKLVGLDKVECQIQLSFFFISSSSKIGNSNSQFAFLISNNCFIFPVADMSTGVADITKFVIEATFDPAEVAAVPHTNVASIFLASASTTE